MPHALPLLPQPRDTLGASRGTLMEPAELLDQAERYRSYWGREGGITVSGGEALLQPEFVAELFEAAHARGINTCLDTSLAPFTRQQPFYQAWERIMAACDLVLADIKHIDPAEHRALTGHSNENILDALRWLSDAGVPVWIRHVLVPGITDNDEYLHRTADFIRIERSPRGRAPLSQPGRIQVGRARHTLHAARHPAAQQGTCGKRGTNPRRSRVGASAGIATTGGTHGTT